MEAENRSVDDWMELLYKELHTRAERLFRNQPADHTLEPGALVNDLYIRLTRVRRSADWKSRADFLAYASRSMQNLLINHAKKPHKTRLRVDLSGLELSKDAQKGLDDDSEAVSIALDKLAKLKERQATVVLLKFLGGLKVDEVAEHLGVSINTVEKDWTSARTWLLKELAK